jgi:hypothetical protein
MSVYLSKIFFGAFIAILGVVNYAVAHQGLPADANNSEERSSVFYQYAQTNNASTDIPGASRNTKKKYKGKCVQAEIKKVYAAGTKSETAFYVLSHHHPRIHNKRHGDKHKSWRDGECHK